MGYLQVIMIASLVLGVYTITLALTESAGPWGLLERLRNVKWVSDFGLLECGLCCSFWVALGLCIAFGRVDLYFIAWGGSVLLDKLVTAYMVK